MNQNESKEPGQDHYQDVQTVVMRSERGGTWWQLMALMSVSAVMIAAVFTVGNELELKKDYVQASEPAGKLQALVVTDRHKRRDPLRLEVTTDRWVYAAKGSFAALLGAELTEETLGQGDRQLCTPQRAICVPIEGRVPVTSSDRKE